MILKGNQRAGGKQLALHLLKTSDNEHVQVHELRGFIADDLQAAFHESYAMSRGTSAEQHLFSLSLNPPSDAEVPISVFEAAIERIEHRLGLEGQPRAIVFHEKEGRRHAHAVWSRIDSEAMKAINLPHYKLKLRDISKELFLEHGWKLPKGFVNSKERDPTNFTHAEWEQAKRAGRDPKALKRMFQECWAASDSAKAFAQALSARGFHLAQGDRRGFVAVDFRGEVYAVAKYAGIKTKDVRARLGSMETLRSVDETRKTIAAQMTTMLKRHAGELEAQRKTQAAAYSFRKNQIVERQREERALLERSHQGRQAKETRERTERITTGFRGLWDRITGKHAQIKYQNEAAALQSFYRDRAEKDAMIFRQLEERQALHRQAQQARQTLAVRQERILQDIARYAEFKREELPPIRSAFNRASALRPTLEPTAKPELER